MIADANSGAVIDKLCPICYNLHCQKAKALEKTDAFAIFFEFVRRDVMSKKRKIISLAVWLSIIALLLVGIILTSPQERHETVYYYTALNYVLPVVVAVLFTLLHALIQTYDLMMLTSVFYGEVSEVHAPREKDKKDNNKNMTQSDGVPQK